MLATFILWFGIIQLQDERVQPRQYLGTLSAAYHHDFDLPELEAIVHLAA
jgi:hypothetical protein